MALLSWRRWVDDHHATLPHCSYLLHALPYLNVKQRKMLLTYARVQQPFEDSRVWRKDPKLAKENIIMTRAPDGSSEISHTSIQQLLRLLPHTPSDAVFQGWLAMAVREAPYHDYSSLHEAKITTREKELLAAVTVRQREPLCYDSILSTSRNDRWSSRLSSNLPLSPLLHDEIHHCLQATKPKLRRLLLYPRDSKKTIGQEARRQIEQDYLSMPLEEGVKDVRHLRDVERVYHESGIRLQGPVEMRSAFKYGDLAPRVYYAIGPTCYHVSKYIQQVFNVIADALPVTHRKNRFEEPSINVLSPTHSFMIYDYSSFTSSLHEIRRFTAALAVFYEDTEVQIVDTHVGVLTVSLMELLLDYNNTCNVDPIFDAARVYDLDHSQSFMIMHNCGMLGVPGNITSSTLLHGLHIAIINKSLHTCRTVGDDARTPVYLGRDPDHAVVSFMDQVQNLGDVAESKFERWDPDYETEDYEVNGWHYTKRPITRLHDRILRGHLFIWPSIASVLELTDPIHTVVHGSLDDRRKRFTQQWSRLLTLIHLSVEPLSDLARDLLYLYQKTSLSELRLVEHARRGGGFVEFPSGLHLHMPRFLERDEIGLDWKQRTLESMPDGWISVPVFREYDDDWSGFESESFLSRSSRLLSLLESLGYVSKELESELISTVEARRLGLLGMYFDLDYRFSYRWTFSRDAPAWVQTCQWLATHDPHERVSFSSYATDVFE